jgi:hypothetical protein
MTNPARRRAALRMAPRIAALSAKNFHHARGRYRHPESRFYGFDSFEGLPEDWGNKAKGTFSRQGEPPRLDDERVRFVVGWFHETLPGFVAEGSDYEAVLVHLDADLYSSTLFALRRCESIGSAESRHESYQALATLRSSEKSINSQILSQLWPRYARFHALFDEFMSHEARALHNFAQAFPCAIEFLAYDHDIPKRVFCRIDRASG